MLGWMLKRGETAPAQADGAGSRLHHGALCDGIMGMTNGIHHPDTSIIDQPDTPAPVFAARAFKSALFGLPAPGSDEAQNVPAGSASSKTNAPSTEMVTPSKPQGILLTPGTGTSRHKRVSFGRDIPQAPSTTNDSALGDRKGETRRRTLLTEALENSRKKAPKNEAANQNTAGAESNSSDEWEEADDDDHCTHDITLDLNEPHSQSGKYWKDECQKYRAEARVEMDKLLRYKQMAKSFARERDSEAVELAEKLRDEQKKVLGMERKIADNASRIASNANGTSFDSKELLTKLTKQTALAVQYRQCVQDLESQLENREVSGDGPIQGRQRRQVASPRTQKTLIDTQRELRRARAQVKELGELREQVSSLKAQLKAADTDEERQPESTRMRDVRLQLRQTKEESLKKDEEIRKLRNDFDVFRQATAAHENDTKAVLERAHAKISDLKKEIKALKVTGPDNSRPKSSDAPSTMDEALKHKVSKSNTQNANDVLRGHATRQIQESAANDQFEEDSSIDMNLPVWERKSLREQYWKEDEPVGASREISTALKDRPKLEEPKWQPFVPRSPRNRAYLGEEMAQRIQNGGVTPAAKPSKIISAPDLPAMVKSIAVAGRSDAKVDLLQDNFAQLGGPEVKRPGQSSLALKDAKSSLPPERRAAALARIEQRMAEKKRVKRREGHDKENIRPIS